MKTPALIALLLLVTGCPPADDLRPHEAETLGSLSKPHPAASCVHCADTSGKNDAKHLCPASADAWDALIECTCAGPCSALCGADWCARLDDPNYTNASDDCNDCAVSWCWAEILGCSSAQ